MQYSFSGDLGDLVYLLSSLKNMEPGELVLFPSRLTTFVMVEDRASLILPLLQAQSYIAKTSWLPGPVGTNLDHWRGHIIPWFNLADTMASWLNQPHASRTEPWLTVSPRKDVPVLFARSLRRHGDFPWKELRELFPDAGFVGLAEEWRAFTKEFGDIPWWDTADLWELACVIAGAPLLCCNESCPRAIAEGLKIPVAVEVGAGNTNWDRPGCWYGGDIVRKSLSIIKSSVQLHTGQIVSTVEKIKTLKEIHGLTDKQVLGDSLQAQDINEDYLQDSKCYAWYYAIGQYYLPESILEIGCRFGYSLLSLLKGVATKKSLSGTWATAVDNESYVPGSMKIVAECLSKLGLAGYALLKADTRKELSQTMTLSKANMVHVDADHTEQGAYNDVRRAWDLCLPGGVILVDDVDYLPEVGKAVSKFCVEKELTLIHLMTFRGLAILEKRDK